MRYRVATIAGLADEFQNLPPIDPSWLPPNTVHIPGGGLAPAPPRPAPPSSSSLVVPIVAVGVAGLAIGFLLFRR